MKTKRKMVNGLAAVVKKSARQAQEIIDDPILQLARSRSVQVGSLMGDKQEIIWSHIVGQDYIHISSISSENLAKLIMLFCLKISGAYGQASLRFRSFGRSMLNTEDSGFITPPGLLKFPKGLSSESPVYFYMSLSKTGVQVDNTGDVLILSIHGLYRWQYEYKVVRGTWISHGSRVKGKQKVVVASVLSSVSIEGMDKLISGGQVVPIVLLYGLRDHVCSISGELRSVQNNMSQVLNFTNGALSRIVH